MHPSRPHKIDIALLYADYAPFAYQPLAEQLQLIFGEHLEVGLGAHEDGAFGIIKVGAIYAMISQNQEPLAPDGFATAVQSPFTLAKHPDAPDLVNGHRKTIFVTVGGRDIVVPDLAEDAIPESLRDAWTAAKPQPKAPSVETYGSYAFVARLIVSQLCMAQRPDLVHWCPSDQLFKPEELVPTDDPKGMRVQIHPNLFSSGAVEQGSQKVGFHAHGAEHVMGRHVIVEETPFPLSRVVTVVHDFIYSLQQSGAVPKHGTVLRTKDGAALRVRHAEADENFPRQYLAVELLDVGGSASAKPWAWGAGKTRDDMTGRPVEAGAVQRWLQKYSAVAMGVTLLLALWFVVGSGDAATFLASR